MFTTKDLSFFCFLGNTNLNFFGINCDFLNQFKGYFFYLGNISDNSILLLIIHLIILILYFYFSYIYSKNKYFSYIYLALFILFLYLGIYYLIFIFIFDVLLYYFSSLFFKKKYLKKIKEKKIGYYSLYSKYIPIFGFISFFRLGLTNKLNIKQLLISIIISNVNLILTFILIVGFINHLDMFIKLDILNNKSSWENQNSLYIDIITFLIIYIIGIYLYFFKYKKNFLDK